jgi:hypothetical protein
MLARERKAEKELNMLRRITLGLAAAALWMAASAGTVAAEAMGPFCIRNTDADAEVTTEYRFNIHMVTSPQDFPSDMYLVYAVHGIRLADETEDFLPISGTMFIRFLGPDPVIRISFSDSVDIKGEDETTIIGFPGLPPVEGMFITERADEEEPLSGVSVVLPGCAPLPAS